ncbi:MAG: PilZ domain-containing protein [Elusimicrobiota bacterium]
MPTTIKRKRPTANAGYEEKRRHRRVRISPLLIEPIQIRIPETKVSQPAPGIIADISAGGIALMTYLDLPIGTQIDLGFNLFGLKLEKLKGRVARVKEHYNTYMMAIIFDKACRSIDKHIDTVSMDFEDCETKWVRGEENICKKTCSYYDYCTKPVKK